MQYSSCLKEKSQFKFMKPEVPESSDLPTQLDLAGST